jgi:hypothetical protein
MPSTKPNKATAEDQGDMANLETLVSTLRGLERAGLLSDVPVD